MSTEPNKLWGTLIVAFADLGFLEVEAFDSTVRENLKAGQGQINRSELPWELLNAAEDYLHRSLLICETFPNAKLEAEINKHLATTALGSDDVRASEFHHREAIRLYKVTSDYQRIFETYESLVNLLNSEESSEEALGVLHEALDDATNSGQVGGETRVRHLLLNQYARAGKWVKSLEVFEGWKHDPHLFYTNKADLGKLLVSLGDVCETELGDVDKAIRYYEDAIKELKVSNAPSMAVNPRLRVARLWADVGRITEALNAVAGILRSAPSLEDVGQRAHILAGAGQILCKLKRYNEAKDVFLSAVAAAEAASDA